MSDLAPLTTYRLTEHARLEMNRRQIGEAEIAFVLATAEQTELVRAGRAVYQSQVKLGDLSRVYLIRVVVDIDRYPPEVVTVYRTSKIEKYWRTHT